jgi:hypothetical protein
MKPRVFILASFAAALASPAALANAPVSPENTAERVIPIDASTEAIKVTDGEVVILEIGGEQLTWHVDAIAMHPFDLGRVVPEAQGVMVYVEPDPKYQGA